MPGHCCVPQCLGKGGHRFPKCENKRRKWVQAVKRGEPNRKPQPWTTVCAAHFTAEDYLIETVESKFLKFNSDNIL